MKVKWSNIITLLLVLFALVLGSVWTADSAESFALTRYLKPEDRRFFSLILVGIGIGVVTAVLVRLARKI